MTAITVDPPFTVPNATREQHQQREAFPGRRLESGRCLAPAARGRQQAIHRAGPLLSRYGQGGNPRSSEHSRKKKLP